MEEHHYYPFGMKHANYNDPVHNYIDNPDGTGYADVAQVAQSKYRYRFNGQEWQDELGLNMTAMDYRQYDNALGRFHSVDALSELASGINPYQFGFNNPVYWSDPTGLFPSRAAAMQHISQFGLSNASVSYNEARGYWEISNDGYNFWESSGGDLWLNYSSAGGANFVNLGGSGMALFGDLEGINVGRMGFDVSLVDARLQSTGGYEWKDFASFASRVNWTLTLGTTGLQNTTGSFRLTNGAYNGSMWSPHYYRSAWIGGSKAKITTYNIGKVGTFASRGLVGFGIAVDSYSWYNGDISGAKLGTNTGVALWGLTGVGTIPSIFYFGAEAFHPQGFDGLMNDAERGHTATRKILGPGWRPIPFGGK